ncbi:hypothetical protein MAM1_0216c08176 [Mucor ambiguus]|uniref:Uncharacterized protein n=1 Tax=Mucor ambiguus TaxID=91626 RepID=A0A0C9MDF0_9FUNG|nr:hypothetical protein MAM1_0216c08176 [Mucor ambiguus]
MSKFPSNSNGADDPSPQRKPYTSCKQFGRMGGYRQSCPKNLRNKQALANSIANRLHDLPSDARSSTNVSFEDENEGYAVDSRVVDNNNGTANVAEAKVINDHGEEEAIDDVALLPAAKYSKNWIHLRSYFSC